VISRYSCVLLLLALLTAGCEQQERPETTAYRKQVETLRIQNSELQQKLDVSARVLNVTTVALVTTGCGLAVTLFALVVTRRRRN
jgi:hypothetical protein